MTSEHKLITPRRNFLVRALGFTAAGATMAIPITTLADAEARIDHHKGELEKALRDRYGTDIFTHINLPEPNTIGFDERTRRRYRHEPILFFGTRGGGWIDP
jgi:hypothetical protein